jgi:hypothetical protein
MNGVLEPLHELLQLRHLPLEPLEALLVAPFGGSPWATQSLRYPSAERPQLPNSVTE